MSPPNLYIEALVPSETAFGNKAFKQVLRLSKDIGMTTYSHKTGIFRDEKDARVPSLSPHMHKEEVI